MLFGKEFIITLENIYFPTCPRCGVPGCTSETCVPGRRSNQSLIELRSLCSHIVHTISLNTPFAALTLASTLFLPCPHHMLCRRHLRCHLHHHCHSHYGFLCLPYSSSIVPDPCTSWHRRSYYLQQLFSCIAGLDNHLEYSAVILDSTPDNGQTLSIVTCLFIVFSSPVSLSC
jgi:hypothetical protein